jgi:hypothetical protein
MMDSGIWTTTLIDWQSPTYGAEKIIGLKHG